MAPKADEELDKLEEDIRRLKNAYDQFFAGMQKTPPMFLRRNIEANIHELNKLKMRDNMRRYRFNTLITRFNQFREMWGRRMREREEGPLDFRKRQAALEAPMEALPPPRPTSSSETSGEADPYVKVAGGTSSDEVRRLYDQIQSEHSKLGKPSNVTYEQLSAMVEKQGEMVRSKYNVNAVSFRVETIDGKVKLKAKPLQE
ncbi:MAG: hypothetical protein JJE51_00655 [Thermoanaerobaculia bacterium]|nr:hypothetical protein [Thermoanaerobaculia bacterium]